MAPGMDASQLLPKSRLGDTGHCSAGLVFLLPCTFAWGGFGGKPRCTMLSRTGTNPCSRGGGGRAVIQPAPSSALRLSPAQTAEVPGGSLDAPEFGGNPVTERVLQSRVPHHPSAKPGLLRGNGFVAMETASARPGPPRRQPDPRSIRRLPFIFNRAQQHRVAFVSRRARSSSKCSAPCSPWPGGTIHISLQLQSTGPSQRENKHGWMSKSEFNPHCFHRLLPLSQHL